MNRVALGLITVGLIGLVAAGLLGQPVIAFFSFFVAVLGAFLRTQSRVKARYESDPETGLSPDLRSELGPLRSLRRKIETFVQENPQDPVVSVVGGEAVREAEMLHVAAAESMRVRQKLRRAMAAQTAQVVTADAETAASVDALKSAYTAMQQQIQSIETDLERSHAKLGEIYSVMTSQSLAEAGKLPADDIRERLSQLQSLTASLHEARDSVSTNSL